MTFPILASLLVRLVVLLPFQLLRLSLATPSRWTPLALSVFLHCVVALLLTLLYIFTFYVPHRHVYGEQWIKFMKDGVNATPLLTVNTTGYIDHAAFLGTINPEDRKSGSAGMPRPISYAVFCLKKKKKNENSMIKR